MLANPSQKADQFFGQTYNSVSALGFALDLSRKRVRFSEPYLDHTPPCEHLQYPPAKRETIPAEIAV